MTSEDLGFSLEQPTSKKRLHSEREQGAAGGAATEPSSSKEAYYMRYHTCKDPKSVESCFLLRNPKGMRYGILRLMKISSHVPVLLEYPPDYADLKVVKVVQTGEIYDIQIQHSKLEGVGTYQGCIKDGKAHGFGRYTSLTGEKYEGFWRDGMRNGQGTFTREEASYGDRRVQYQGSFKNSYPDGQGTLTSFSNGTYEGEWSEGKRHGQGKHTLPCGCSYEGTFDSNQISGQGILYPAMGGSMQAHFTNGQITDGSEVTITYKNGDKYEGHWKEGVMSGTGRFKLTQPCTTVDIGEFVAGKKHGHGTLTQSDGSKYVGEWQNDLRHGHGTLTYPDGSQYVGEWQNDLRQGHGTLTHSDGSQYVGEWQNDLRHGIGKIIQADGSSAGLGRWENSVCRRMLHNTVSVDNPEQAYPACTICAAAPVDMVVYPCAHMHFCSTCIDRWLNGLKKGICPSCKGIVTGTQRVFLP